MLGAMWLRQSLDPHVEKWASLQWQTHTLNIIVSQMNMHFKTDYPEWDIPTLNDG